MAPDINNRGKTFAMPTLPLLVLVCSLSLSLTVEAAVFPMRPIRMIVPSAPGGSPDIGGRMIANELTRQMGQQVLVDNRPGAGGLLGLDMIAKSPPDGYTLGYVTFFISTSPSLIRKLPFEAMRDFQWVIHQTTVPNLLAVTQSLPVTSVPTLIDHARAYRGKLSYGSVGNGTSMHLSMELFQSMTGTKMLHVPYKGIQQAITDVIGGQLDVVCDNLASILPHVRANRLRAMGVTTLKRSPIVPDLPTVAESVPGYEIAPWGGYALPARVPREITLRFNAEINKALAVPAVAEKFASFGSIVIGGSPEQFAEHVRRETVKWAGVLKAAGVVAE
jgi:tripartite-type tricarboxylate transporter receptor subunit TctC